MKKKLLAGLLVSASVLGVVAFGGVTSYAADTEVRIGFSMHTDPGEEIGDLKLRWVPTVLDFGMSNTVNTSANYDFLEQEEVAGDKKYVVIEDSRLHGISDPSVEWKLSAGVSELVSTTSATTKLTGAVLKFEGDLQSYSGTVDPTIAGISAAAGQTANVVPSGYALDADGVTGSIKTIMNDGDASGTTSFHGDTAMQLKNIKLSVLANVAQKGHEYKGKLTWTLADTI